MSDTPDKTWTFLAAAGLVLSAALFVSSLYFVGESVRMRLSMIKVARDSVPLIISFLLVVLFGRFLQTRVLDWRILVAVFAIFYTGYIVDHFWS